MCCERSAGERGGRSVGFRFGPVVLAAEPTAPSLERRRDARALGLDAAPCPREGETRGYVSTV